MDRAGSGLSDLWQATINNNGDASFGPDSNNEFFVVELHARPEVVDGVTNTAIAATQQTHRFAANVLHFHQLPERIWCAPTNVTTMRGLRGKKNAENLPGGHLHDQAFYTMFDLDRLGKTAPLPFSKKGIHTLTVTELLDSPNGRVIFVKLLNEVVFEHLRAIGLWIDYRRKRAHYPKPDDDDERKVSYQARVRKATRTVVKVRKRRNSEGVAYYEHKAIGFLPMEFGIEWALVLSPGYTFTRDGKGTPIGRDRINVLSTRRAARDFNQVVHQDIAFWTAVLSEESNGIFALRCRDELEECAPTVLLSSRLPTVSYRADSFSDSQDSWDSTAQFDELESEIMALAELEAEEQLGENDQDEAE